MSTTNQRSSDAGDENGGGLIPHCSMKGRLAEKTHGGVQDVHFAMMDGNIRTEKLLAEVATGQHEGICRRTLGAKLAAFSVVLEGARREAEALGATWRRRGSWLIPKTRTERRLGM